MHGRALHACRAAGAAGAAGAAAARRASAAGVLRASVAPSATSARAMSVLLKRYEGQHEVKNFTMVRVGGRPGEAARRRALPQVHHPCVRRLTSPRPI